MEEILRILEKNCRTDPSEISELTGMKEKEVRDLICCRQIKYNSFQNV